MNALHLGASLYVPATRNDLAEILDGHKHADVRSLVLCLGDSVAANEQAKALTNLEQALAHLRPNDSRMVFLQPSSALVLGHVLRMPGALNLRGIVVPRATADSLPAYVRMLARHELEHRLWIMPTLETSDVFDPKEMDRLHDLLVSRPMRERVLSLRIGGAALLDLLELRRSTERTVYESPLGTVISQLVCRFKPSGFNIAAPACDHLTDDAVLAREVAQDLEFGLFGKTAVHPDQVQAIERHYRPTEASQRMADAILAPNAPASFYLDNVLCEPATHARWARQVRERAKVYGAGGAAADLRAAA